MIENLKYLSFKFSEHLSVNDNQVVFLLKPSPSTFPSTDSTLCTRQARAFCHKNECLTGAQHTCPYIFDSKANKHIKILKRPSLFELKLGKVKKVGLYHNFDHLEQQQSVQENESITTIVWQLRNSMFNKLFMCLAES